MKFSTLKEEEFTKFALNHEQASFHQTINWGKLKEENGWKMHLVGIKEKNKIMAASLLLSKMTPIKKNMFYAPRGFLIDYNNLELLSFFTDNIKKYIKENKGIFLKIDPYISYQERDLYGNIVKDGKNNKKAYDNLISLGYKHLGFNQMQEELQPRWIFITPTKNKTIEEIMQNMDPKTRQILRKNERNKVKVREIEFDELAKIKDILRHTGDRRGFIDRPLEYYQNMYKYFHDDGYLKAMLAEVNLDELINEINKDIKLKEEEMKTREEKKNQDPKKVNMEKYQHKQQLAQDEINRLKKNLKHYEDLKEKHGNLLTLGGIIFFVYGNEVLSSVGGSYEEFMEFQSAYTLHFYGLNYALTHNFERYNFYGITGVFDESNPLFGLYSFKRDFGGQVVELIGEFDLIVDKPATTLYKISFRAYRLAKNIKNKLLKNKA